MSIPVLERFEQFIVLCNRLYDDLGEVTGGMLHAELEDHNLDHLLGDIGRRSRQELQDHLDGVATIPWLDRIDPSYWPERPEIECCIAILDLTIDWSTVEIHAAYMVWHISRGEELCCPSEFTACDDDCGHAPGGVSGRNHGPLPCLHQRRAYCHHTHV